jgi:hypothetical protein
MVYLGDKLLEPNVSSVNGYLFNQSTGTFTFGVDLQNDQVIQILYRNQII